MKHTIFKLKKKKNQDKFDSYELVTGIIAIWFATTFTLFYL